MSSPDSEWIQWLRDHEDEIRREANSNAPDADLFAEYVAQLEAHDS